MQNVLALPLSNSSTDHGGGKRLTCTGTDENRTRQSPGGKYCIVVVFLIAWSISSAVMRTIILLVTNPISFATTERAAAEMLSGASKIMTKSASPNAK